MPKSDSMRIDAQRGFTLLEVMVVLLILGIAMGTASVAAFGDSAQRTLHQDAERLAGLFMLAQTEARAAGGRIVWQADAQGFAFTRVPRPLVLPARVAARSSLMRETRFGAASPLRPRPWLSSVPVAVSIEPEDVLSFGGDWVGAPAAITLHSGDRAVQIVRSATGRYEVRP